MALLARDGRRIGLFLALLLLVTALSPARAQLGPAEAATPTPLVSSEQDAARAKLDPRLSRLLDASGPQTAAAWPAEVLVDAFVAPGTGNSAAGLFEQSVVRRLAARPSFDEQQQPTGQTLDLGLELVSGKLRVERLLKLASLPTVASVRQMGVEPPASASTAAPDMEAKRAWLEGLRAQMPAPAIAHPRPQGWFEKRYNEWERAWAAGYTGEGVKVAVLDSGIDFAHPDLNGLQARVTNPASRFFYAERFLSSSMRARFPGGLGLPIAFDGGSLSDYIFDLPDRQGNWRFYINTRERYTPREGLIEARGKRYRVPAEARGEVRLAFSSDAALSQIWNDPTSGERGDVAILLANTGRVDLDRNGKFDDFDTVYTDLNFNQDFRDDKPAFLGDETMWWDADGDGLADLSGGMVYFVADGLNPIPAIDWLYGAVLPFEKLVPAKGDLLALMVDDVFEPGGDGHGTRVASNIASKAIVNGNPPALKPPYAGPGDGMVQAAGRDTRLIAISGIYRNISLVDMYLFSLFSYDGLADGPGSRGDDPQIATMSFGFHSRYVDESFDAANSRLLGVFNALFNPYVLYVTAAGNGGPGRGTLSSPAPWTGLTIGAATQFNGQVPGLEPLASLEQARYGDVAPFSNGGPDARGTAGIDAVANGAWGTGGYPLNGSSSGAAAWRYWNGSSRSAPSAGGALSLGYEAWRERSGRWPSYREARDLLMSTATYNFHPPARTGAGLLNAGRLALAAGGVDGSWVSPSLWSVGNYRGVERQESGFINVLRAGEADEQSFTLSNPAPRAQRLSLRDARLVEIGQRITGELTTSDRGGATGLPDQPDYLLRLDPARVPADADLLIVRSVQPYDNFDLGDDGGSGFGVENQWELALYGWTDRDGDGLLWTDGDGDGLYERPLAADNPPPDLSEVDVLDVGELNLFSSSELLGVAQEVMVRQPSQRADDGLFIGWKQRLGSAELPSSLLRYEARFYKLADWPELSLAQSMLDVPAGGQARFVARFQAEANAAPGYHEGYILAEAPGSGAFLRVAQLVFDVPELDVYLDGTRVLTRMPYRQISDYLPLSPGLHRLQMVRAGRPPAEALLDTTLDLGAGEQYTAAAAGSLAPNDSLPLQSFVYADLNQTVLGQRGLLRVVHSVANAGPIDIYVGLFDKITQRQPGRPWVRGLQVGQASENLRLPPGQYEVWIFAAGADPAKARPLFGTSQPLEAGRSLLLYTAGDATRREASKLIIKRQNPHLAFEAQLTAIPVTVNVAGSLSTPGAALTLGGGAEAITPHDNGHMFGAFNWYGGGGVGDTRRFFVDLADDVQPGDLLLARTDWEGARPTDVDTLLLGPRAQACEEWFGACDAERQLAYEAQAGPYSFELLAQRRAGLYPRWIFDTPTGESFELLSAGVSPGLHHVVLDQVLSAGERPAVPFSTTVALARVVPPELELLDPTRRELTLTFTSGMTLPDGLQARAFGFSRPQQAQFRWAPEDGASGRFPSQLHGFEVLNGGLIELSVTSADIADIDIYLYHDGDGDGRFAQSERVAASESLTAHELIRVSMPSDGRYLLEIVNYSQMPGSVQLVSRIIQGEGLRVSVPAGPVLAGQPVTLTARVETEITTGAEGLLVFGPPEAPHLISVPVRVP